MYNILNISNKLHCDLPIKSRKKIINKAITNTFTASWLQFKIHVAVMYIVCESIPVHHINMKLLFRISVLVVFHCNIVFDLKMKWKDEKVFKSFKNFFPPGISVDRFNGTLVVYIFDLRLGPAAGTFLSSQIVTPSQEHIFLAEFWKSPADRAIIPQESLKKNKMSAVSSRLTSKSLKK